ncbi:MAG TPA: DUF5348 domain-containing protein [Candidatus Fimiplasma intestinipullorum]|uniref:DUF5348 domain-containing protein n=1 Tax=Candidatus Fimiplasma intestinipullorum TaxID=2840825 RepID=A0A9D1HP54_9FIRM|nr:DUF5348 domain-containing protein [Candidatus Fimiplasma intestinipullorum]
MIRKGYLAYNHRYSRYEIVFSTDETYMLHCGDCFSIYDTDSGHYVPTRIEYDTNWYLIGTSLKTGALVKIDM